MGTLPLGLVALLIAQAPAPLKGGSVRPPAPAGLSWEDADWVAQTVARLERRLGAGKPASRQTIVVTERQLNSWVNLSLASKMPEGLSGLELGLQKDRVVAEFPLTVGVVGALAAPAVAAIGALVALVTDCRLDVQREVAARPPRRPARRAAARPGAKRPARRPKSA